VSYGRIMIPAVSATPIVPPLLAIAPSPTVYSRVEVPQMQKYHAIKRVNYTQSAMGKYIVPTLTAIGFSFAPLVSFSQEQAVVQKEPTRAKQHDISFVIETQRNTREQPRTLEKIKRTIPAYERINAPLELESMACEIEAKYDCVVSFKLIEGKRTYGRNDGSVIPPASISKLGIVYAAMALSEQGQFDLEQKINVKKILEEHPYLLPKNTGKLKESYTGREILTEIVNDSNRGSNRDANILLFLLGKDKVNAILREKGYTNTSFSSDAPFTPRGGYHLNTTTLEEAAALMQELGDPSQWGASQYASLQGILQPSKNWAPFLFGHNEEGITLKRLKHGQTENAMSVVYEAEGKNGKMYTGIMSISNLKGRLVEEDYRKATNLGKAVVNDFVKLSRMIYQEIKRQEAALN
jgi:hypothetical protein